MRVEENTAASLCRREVRRGRRRQYATISSMALAGPGGSYRWDSRISASVWVGELSSLCRWAS